MLWEYKKTIEEVVRGLLKEKFQIISLEQTPTATNLKNFIPKEQFALIVGNEVTGVSKKALKVSRAIVEIPTELGKGSLNVSVATGIALFVLS